MKMDWDKEQLIIRLDIAEAKWLLRMLEYIKEVGDS